MIRNVTIVLLLLIVAFAVGYCSAVQQLPPRGIF